jgi:hypothetical protein
MVHKLNYSETATEKERVMHMKGILSRNRSGTFEEVEERKKGRKKE